MRNGIKIKNLPNTFQCWSKSHENIFNSMNLEYRLRALKKITRRTTGARGCKFLESLKSFLSSYKYQVTSFKQQVLSNKY